MLRRPIPSSGELLPVVGLGTYRTFDVAAEHSPDGPREVLRRFHALGGRVVDTSPMYGHSETVLGMLARDLGISGDLFFATKVWARGEQEGRAQINASFELLGAHTLDLLQVHNMVDLRNQLASLKALKEQGRVRYIGVTHYLSSRHEDLAELVASKALDFVGVNYSLLERNADRHLLPAAADHGVAVLVNQPFETHSLFGWVRQASLPDWAGELGIRTWAQFLLKFVLGHPAVTCVLPATRVLDHLVDNMGAGAEPLPDPGTRRRMAQYFADL